MLQNSQIQVILINGNRIQSEYIAQLFDKEEFAVKMIYDGKEAYEYLTHQASPEAVVLLSYQLKSMDGLSVMEKLRAKGKEIACIFVTADKTVERAIEAMKAGALDFIPKNSKLHIELVPMVRKVFQIQQERLEQKRIRQELHKSQEKLRSTMDSLDDYVIALDKNGVFIDLHVPATTHQALFNAPKMLGKHFENYPMSNNFTGKLANAIKKLQQTAKVQQFDYSVPATGNENLWFSVKVSMRKDPENQFDGATLILRDITKRKNAEIYLLESKDRLKEQYAEIQQKNEEIEAQRDELESQRDVARSQRDQITAQNQKITDSILYARRIQSAVLPPPEYIKHVLKEHFIFYKPRDIVSGDFYWLTQAGQKIVFAAADCTGHGVPGAFMSMLGVSFLNQIVNRSDNPRAAEILNQLRDDVIKSLRQTGKRGEATDGMDMGLIVIDPRKKRIEFAGANNPLYMIRNKNNPDEFEVETDSPTSTENRKNGKLLHVKPDKMPIGIHPKNQRPFKNHVIRYQTGDMIYLFSDGFVDQFGGKKRRKFLVKNFKNLLLDIFEKPLKDQHDILIQNFEEWKDDYKQMDDILVCGIKADFQEELFEKTQGYNWHDKTILVAEDELHNFVLIEEILEETSAKVLMAGNGKEALEMCKLNQSIDLVLMDIRMPEMNGYEATQAIKKIRPALPVVVQTAYTMSGEKEKSFKAGCDDYITKPISSKELLATVSKYI